MAHHFTPDERETLSHLLQEGVSKAEIARRLGRHRQTIFAEIRRNSIPRSYGGRPRYCAVVAQQKADQRRHQARAKKMDHPVIGSYVQERIKQDWSPDEVAGRISVDHAADPRVRISAQTIYTWIYRHDHRRYWERHLRRFPRRKRYQSQIPREVVIHERPPEVTDRLRLGDWEGDTIVGAGKSGALISLVERKSRYTLLIKVPDLKARTVRRVMQRRMRSLSPELRHTITFDRGKEFAERERLERALHMQIYLADPRCPWQRGTNENTNGLVRQYFPKGTRFGDVSQNAVARVQFLLNERPRKCLRYRTPKEELFQPASDAIQT